MSGEEFDGGIDDVEMPADVRAAAEARIAAAVARYAADGDDATDDGADGDDIGT